jgi:hypothetical protein
MLANAAYSRIKLISSFFLPKIYTTIAKKLTKWENPETKTEYHDSLILKFFVFAFVNNYGSLFYIAFFRQVLVFFLLTFDDCFT